MHKHFLRKIPTVLGELTSAKFYAHAQGIVGGGAKRDTPIYRFPERETMLMVMSYDYDMQSQVYDAWRKQQTLPATTREWRHAILHPVREEAIAERRSLQRSFLIRDAFNQYL